MSVKEYIKAIAAFGILVTVFMAGFGVSGSIWGASNAGLQNDLRRARDELDKARGELEKIKLEYSQYRDSHPATERASVVQPPQGTPAPHGGTALNPLPPQSGATQIALSAGQSESAESGEVVISVIGIGFEGDPLRNRVTFAVGGQGAPTTTYAKQDVGAVVKWGKFEVRLMSADTFEARFMVRRLGAP